MLSQDTWTAFIQSDRGYHRVTDLNNIRIDKHGTVYIQYTYSIDINMFINSIIPTSAFE